MSEVIFASGTYGALAEEDIVNARAVVSMGCGTPRAAAFWCEQAAEKYFKHCIAYGVEVHSENLAEEHELFQLSTRAGFPVLTGERHELSRIGSAYFMGYPLSEEAETPVEFTWDEVGCMLKLVERIRDYTLGVCSNAGVKETRLQVVICPHCGKEMDWNIEEGEWSCPHCGYLGTLEEDPMDYVLPPSGRSR